jgi:hypothetical protein
VSVQPRLPSLYEPESVNESGAAERRVSEDESLGFVDMERAPPFLRPNIPGSEPKRPARDAPSGSRIAERARDRIPASEAEPEAGIDAAALPQLRVTRGPPAPPASDGSAHRVADIQPPEALRPRLATSKPAPQATDVPRSSAEDETPPDIDADQRSESTASKSFSTPQTTRESMRGGEKESRSEKATERLRTTPRPDATVAPALLRAVSPAPAPQTSTRLNPSRLSGTAPIPPRVQVTIGRIEIRATQTRAPQPLPQRRELGMSLEEYLAKRERG